MTMEIVRSLGMGWFLEWGFVNVRCTIGEVLVFWNNRLVDLIGLEVGEFSILCRFKNRVDEFVWVFIAVYGPSYGKDREDL